MKKRNAFSFAACTQRIRHFHFQGLLFSLWASSKIMSGPRTKIFVGHLPDGCKNEDLQALFEKHGVVKECDVINKYGFVHMSTPEEAEEAIKKLNNYNLMGSCISVEPSKSKLHPAPGAPGRAKQTFGRSAPSRNGYPSGRSGSSYGSMYSNGYRPSPYARPSSDPYYDRPFGFGHDRMRSYPPSVYERRSEAMSLREEYARRLPPPPGTSDPYARPIPSLVTRDELYERRPPLSDRTDYLYSRRSPPPSSLSRPYWYGDSLADGAARPIPSTSVSRRPPAYY